MTRGAIAALAGAALAAGGVFSMPSPTPPPASAAEELPVLGARLAPLPDGPGKSVADAACLSCHSADLIRQQRLTAKQWEANVTKMAGWGAPVPDDQREALLAYLVQNFGPDNDRFEPVVARPVGR